MGESIKLSDFVGFGDILLLISYLVVIVLISYNFIRRHIKEEPIFRFYYAGLAVKLTGAFAFILVYYLYYPGGDTFYYFTGAKVLSNFSLQSPLEWFKIMLGDNSYEKWGLLDNSTGPPLHFMLFKVKDYFFLIRLLFPFMILSFNKLLIVTVLVNVILFNINFKFIRLISKLYPEIDKYLAFTILFTPSIIFWASGILKDSFCFTATLYIVVNFYNIFVNKKKVILNLIILIINIIIIINLKPYIILALFPSLAFLFIIFRIKNIKNKIVKFVLTPFITLVAIVITYFIFSAISDSLGQYSSLAGVLKKAQVTQQDLIRPELYGTNSYNIGPFDATIIGITKKIPIALFDGIFRPFIWEARNPLMVLSGFENLLFSIIFLYFLVKFRILLFFKNLFKDYFISFCFFFGTFFIFSVGLTNANFGALVRLRIPGIPFLFIPLIILIYLRNKELKSDNTPPVL